jgi:hypothetical protein
MSANVRACLLLALCAASASAAVMRQGDICALVGDTYILALRADTGAIVALTRPGELTSMASSDAGLWSLRRLDGSFTQPGPARVAVDGDRLILDYGEVEVTLTSHPDYVEFAAHVQAAGATVTGLDLPARLRLDPARVQRALMPANGNDGVGMAFNGGFFGLQSQDHPSGWANETIGGAGYHALFGGDPAMRPLDDPDVALKATDVGRKLFGAGLAARIDAAKECVFRPSDAKDVDEVLIDSPVGPYFVRKNVGTGAIWRLSGRISEPNTALARSLVAAAVDSLGTPAGRTTIALLALRRGPEAGGFSSVPVAAWHDTLAGCAAVRAGRAKLVDVDSTTALSAALAADQDLIILNPYGEGLPVAAGEEMAVTIDRIKAWMTRGGHWFEVAGYPFHYAMRPQRYLTYAVTYPAAFSDWLHVDTNAGSFGLWRVQPRDWQPFAGAADKRDIFYPGGLSCGGDAKGGWIERYTATWVPAGTGWDSPPVRLTVGRTPEAELADYARLNGIRRGLADKVKPEVLDKLKRSVLVFVAGSARDKIAALAKLPAPCLIHFADYLHGGFDKQYPDHLPPNASFGTEAELRDFFARAHAAGDFVEPYTNPTWWCIGPKGPTFEREGEAPLLKNLDGKPNFEKYAANAGYTDCHWHPATRAANDNTRRQFTEDFPVDVLFQDQCGARGWAWDLNPASPTPYAYSEGLLSMVDDDSTHVPLGTEAGWDRVVNGETQLCGLSWDLSPHRRDRAFDDQYPPDVWTIYPLAERLAHDKCFMMYHDLGQFCTDPPTLAWAMSLGFSLSYRLAAADAGRPTTHEWLAWLDRLQKTVVAPTIGAPLDSFEQARTPNAAAGDDGLVTTGYAGQRWSVNLGAVPRAAGDVTLAPYGFHVQGPGVRAGVLAKLGAISADDDGLCFVSSGGEFWAYGRGGAPMAVEMDPAPAPGAAVTVEGRPVAATVTGAIATFTLPAAAAGQVVAPPAALAAKAPRDWPGTPAIGVLDLGAGVGLSWSSVMPADFMDALSAANLGLPVRRIGSGEELAAALTAGATHWIAIVNPYGEMVPSTGAGQARATLSRIRDYVNHGGIWFDTGGYSFHQSTHRAGDGWEAESVGPSGAATVGIPVGDGPLEAGPEPLRVTTTGRAWLGEAVAAKIESAGSPINRGLPRGGQDPGHVALVTGASTAADDFIGGYRLDGWGWLWRIGGMNPEPRVVLAAVSGTLAWLTSHAPQPRQAAGPRRLWHGKVGR